MPSESNLPLNWRATLTSFPGISSIRLYTQTMEHIRERHPEVVDTVGEDGVIETVVNPTLVLEGNTDQGKSFVFVSDNIKLRRASLNVPVKLIEGTTSARVRTAYFKSGTPASPVSLETK